MTIESTASFVRGRLDLFWRQDARAAQTIEDIIGELRDVSGQVATVSGGSQIEGPFPFSGQTVVQNGLVAGLVSGSLVALGVTGTWAGDSSIGVVVNGDSSHAYLQVSGPCEVILSADASGLTRGDRMFARAGGKVWSGWPASYDEHVYQLGTFLEGTGKRATILLAPVPLRKGRE